MAYKFLEPERSREDYLVKHSSLRPDSSLIGKPQVEYEAMDSLLLQSSVQVSSHSLENMKYFLLREVDFSHELIIISTKKFWTS
jgi:hypothetical protein